MKERVIFCMGYFMGYLGDRFGDDLKFLLLFFLDRLRNEIIRLVVVKVLTLVVVFSLRFDL